MKYSSPSDALPFASDGSATADRHAQGASNDDTEAPTVESVEALRAEVLRLCAELSAKVEAELARPSRLDRLNPLWEKLWWSDPEAVREEWELGLRHLNEVRLQLLDQNPLHMNCDLCGYRRGDFDADRAAEHVRHYVERLKTAWKPVDGEVAPW